jgi:hypothetical protein
VLDLIARATAAQRADGDPALARRLVPLRHLAYRLADRVPGHPSWPLELPDPLPDVVGIPSVPAAALSPELVGGALVNHGCLRVDGLLRGDQIDLLVDHIEAGFGDRDLLVDRFGSLDGVDADAADEAVQARGEERSSSFVPYPPGRTVADGFGSAAFVRVIDVPAAMCDLIDLFESSGIAASIGSYLGERPALIAYKWGLRRSAGGKIGTDFHQDGAFLGAGIRTVNCWIALTDCGPGTGRPAMDLVPRRFPLLPPDEGAAFSWSVSEEVVVEASDGVPMESPVFAAGDALLFDERLPHRTTVGPELGTRHAVESWFVAPSSYALDQVAVIC